MYGWTVNSALFNHSAVYFSHTILYRQNGAGSPKVSNGVSRDDIPVPDMRMRIHMNNGTGVRADKDENFSISLRPVYSIPPLIKVNDH